MIYAGVEEQKERAHRKGLEQGRREGHAEGLAEVRRERRAEWLATLVCRQAKLKFGARTGARLSTLLEGVTDLDRRSPGSPTGSSNARRGTNCWPGLGRVEGGLVEQFDTQMTSTVYIM